MVGYEHYTGSGSQRRAERDEALSADRDLDSDHCFNANRFHGFQDHFLAAEKADPRDEAGGDWKLPGDGQCVVLSGDQYPCSVF
ncbi:hypothetical protein D3C81_1823640 [compost metagenome]